MHKTFNFKYDLYGLYDRAFEGCMVKITVQMSPKAWDILIDPSNELLPESEKIVFMSVELESDTKKYLEGIYTDTDKLLVDIKKHFTEYYDSLLEETGEALWETHGPTE